MDFLEKSLRLGAFALEDIMKYSRKLAFNAKTQRTQRKSLIPAYLFLMVRALQNRATCSQVIESFANSLRLTAFALKDIIKHRPSTES